MLDVPHGPVRLEPPRTRRCKAGPNWPDLCFFQSAAIEGIAMHAILGFITVGSVGVSSLFLALAAISDGLGDLD